MKYKIGVSAFGKFFTVPCSAVENYLKLTDGAFYKVLVCVLCTNSEIADTEEIAQRCAITPSQAEDALIFWNENGVISAQSDGNASRTPITKSADAPCEQNSPQALPVCLTDAVNPMKKTAAAKSKIRYTPKDLAQKAKDNAELQTLYDEVQKVFGRPINGTETAGFVNLYEYYGYSVPSILIIAQYCHDMGKDKIAYIESVARDWFSRGICEYSQVEAEIIRQTELHTFESKIMRVLGIEGAVTKIQSEFFTQWKEWGFDIETIDLAGQRCREEKNKTKIDYINGILNNWNKDGLHTAQAVLNSESTYKRKTTKEAKDTSYDLNQWRDMAERFDPDNFSFEEAESI